MNLLIKMIKLVTFLGNPGTEYQKTRHNLGWLLAEESSIIENSNWQKKFKGVFSQQKINGDTVYFLKPHTYMNKSGESVQAINKFYKIEPTQALVVHDEIELNFGQIDFKKGGGVAGHNGLRSVAVSLGTRDFYRLRLGVSRPAHGNVSAYVLAKFSQDEWAMLPQYLEKAAQALEYCLWEGFESAEKKYRKKVLI